MTVERSGAPVYAVDPDALHLLREFRADPFGPHSPELTKVLNVLRSGPMEGKLCLVCTRPHTEWPQIQHNRVFNSLGEAEWAVFKLRWREATGLEVDEEALSADGPGRQ